MSPPHISLRRLVDDDVDFLAEMLGDPEVMRYWPAPLDRGGAQEWLERQQRRYRDDGCGYWLIVDHETHQPVGQAGVLMTAVEGEADRLPALGYMIHRPFQRQGYALGAARLCLAHITRRHPPHIAYTLVRPENEPSMALARKLGMQPMRTILYAGLEHVLLSMDARA